MSCCFYDISFYYILLYIFFTYIYFYFFSFVATFCLVSRTFSVKLFICLWYSCILCMSIFYFHSFFFVFFLFFLFFSFAVSFELFFWSLCVLYMMLWLQPKCHSYYPLTTGSLLFLIRVFAFCDWYSNLCFSIVIGIVIRVVTLFSVVSGRFLSQFWLFCVLDFILWYHVFFICLFLIFISFLPFCICCFVWFFFSLSRQLV